MGNPALFPLFYRGASEDIVIVHINPIERSEVPTTAPDILDRTNEISFNAVLLAELRAIAFVARLREEEAVDATRYKHIRVHSIRDEAEMSRHGAASKFDTDWEFLTGLRDAGRRAAEHWLARDARKVGIEGSIDLSRFL